MASYTPNINLKKPTTSEYYNVLDENQNKDKIDTAIGTLNSQFVFQRGDEYYTRGGNFEFRTLSDKSGIFFSIRLPKGCASNVNSVTVEINADSPTWFTSGSLGAVQTGATVSNVSLGGGKAVVQFSVPVPNTITDIGFGICSLNAKFTFGA